MRACHFQSPVLNAAPLLLRLPSASESLPTKKRRHALQIHRHAALANDDRHVGKRLVCRSRDVSDLQRVIIPRATLAPVERLEWEHALPRQRVSR